MLNHATVRVGPLTNIPFVLSSLGCTPEPIIKKSGFDIVQFEDPDNRISFLKGSKLLSLCVKTTGCQSFGFLLGQHAIPSHLGIAGFLLSSAPNVGAALNSLVKYLELHDQGGVVTLTTNDRTALLGYSIIQPKVPAAEQIYDLSLVTACKIMRALCGEKWTPNEVLLARKKPDNLKPYKLFFQAPIRFNSKENALVFKKDLLNHCIPSADPLLQSHLIKEAEKLHLQQNEQFMILVQKLLHQCLVNQQFTATEMAKQLGIHERTLHRRLKSHDTSFRHELELTRFAISKQLLSETNEPLINIAISLGYSSSGTFIRSFKQWSGQSPAKWRKEFSNY